MSLFRKAIALLVTGICAIILYGPDTHQQFIAKIRDYAGWLPMRIVIFSIGLLSLLWFIGMFIPDSIKKSFRKKTEFDRLMEKHGQWSFSALWGGGGQWLDTTIRGVPLTERVIYLICATERTAPKRAKHTELQLPENLLPAFDKQLRLTYPDGQFVEISELDGVLRLDSMLRVFPPDPTPKHIIPVAPANTPGKQQFNVDDIVYTEYGSIEKGFNYWLITGGTGESLAKYLRELLNRPSPEKLTNELIGFSDRIDGPHKRLRFKLSDGRCFFLEEYGRITIGSAMPMASFQPFPPGPLPRIA